MHAGSEGSAGIDLHQQLVLVLLRYGLPGGFNQDMVHGKRLKVLFPVVDPVLILCLARSDGPGAQIGEQAQLIQSLFHLLKDFLRIRVIVQVKADLGNPLVRRKLREDIDEHPLCLLVGQGNIVFYLNPLNPNIIEHAADQVHRFRGGG